ncbi:LamG-like jellyroll fold domain-containing protein [Ferruginibacter albus]|uniref:LamG-like jellyroll fold domain-containing protein n=1 Tax=Ferruginibacter albus TaxID=2875540 RepID=UPI001CC7A951|nr:LamG-like jellyroll fold domain-containing protein [Ferruginibacter albus]UAY51300.1 choice-of-anchor D domain-containing protein [Ferruginibacter albus]
MKKDLRNTRKTYRLIAYVFVLLLSHSSVFSQSGNALYFNGSGDYVTLPFTLSGSYTKEAWIKADNSLATGNIISGTDEAFDVVNGILTVAHISPSYAQVADGTNTPLDPGVWYHVAVTYNAATGDIKLYKNGVEVGSGTLQGYTDAANYIGAFQAGFFWAGQMDEVRIWNTVRTATQINDYQDSSLTGDEPGLMAYYNFNQGVGGADNTAITSLPDSADKCSPYNGTFNGFALNGSISNFVSSGVVLAGAAANIYPNISVSGNSSCINTGDNTPSTTDSTNFGVYVATPITVNYIISNTGGADLTISSITIGGTDPSSFSVVGSPVTSVAAGSSAVLQVQFAPTGNLGVKNAQVIITNDDGDEGTFTYAVTGNYAGPGKSLAMDGVDDYVALTAPITGSYTKEAWIKPNFNTVIGGFPNILSGTNTALFINNGKLATGHFPNFNQLTDVTPLNADTWYHVAVTYDSVTQELRLYKNGVLIGDSVGNNPPQQETALEIGRFSGSNYFGGVIDEVRIWNTVRTPAEILAYKDSSLTGDEPFLQAYYDFKNGVAGGVNTGIDTLYDVSHKGCTGYGGKLHNFDLNNTVSNWIADTPVIVQSVRGYPNINITGNAICIAAGDTTTSVVDNTDFGVANGGTLSKTFTIKNTGASPLFIDSVHVSGTDSSNFSVSSGPLLTTIAPGNSMSLTIQFHSTDNLYKTARVTVYSDDADAASFSFAVSSTAVLPVTWQSFTGKLNNDVAQLTWKTSAEINNSGYEVWRSADNGKTWQKIGFVNAADVSSVYDFVDETPLQGTNLYRLKQVDKDGNFSYSNTVVLTYTLKGAAVTIYPNPVKTALTIQVTNNKLLNTSMRLTSATGKTLSVITLTNTRQTIDLSRYPQGVYFISFSNGIAKKIIKQ